MKKYLLLLLVCFCTSVVMAQRPFEPTYLGTLPGLTLELKANMPNRVEFEIPMPKENVNTTTCLYGPGQPRIERREPDLVFSVNTKMLKMEVGEQPVNVFYELPVDKWYNYKRKIYTTIWQDTYLEEGWNQCYYEICISINMTQY